MRTCSNDGCDRPHYGRGLCKRCYHRAWTKGTHVAHPREIVEHGASIDERLRHHGWTVNVATACWEWGGYRNPKGYGQLAVGRHRGDPQQSVPMLATRAAYAAWVGKLGDADNVLHRCDNPPCINPRHLFLGTRATNNADAVSKRRNANGERRPHKLTDAQVREIRLRYLAGGVTQRSLAEEFDVSQQLIGLILDGRRRANPTNPSLASPR